MSNVLINREKIDILANAISDKSGVPVTMTLAEMVEAVDGIETGGGEPNLQAKTYTVDSAGTETITADSGYDGLSSVSVSVPAGSVAVTTTGNFITINGTKYFRFSADAGIDSDNDMGTEGYISDHTIVSDYGDYSIVPSGTSVTPTESAQTVGGMRRVMEDAVTVNAIPSNYVGSGITRRDSTDLSASGATVTIPRGYYPSQTTKSVASGTAGTPTATKGMVSNHSVSVTPSVTNTTGYIIGSTKTGTAVTVSASELVNGNLSITQNGNNIDCTNYSTVSVNVSGGGDVPQPSNISIGTATRTLTSAASSISFTGLSGEPTSFAVCTSAGLSTGASPWKTAMVVYDGSMVQGDFITNTNNQQLATSTSTTYSSITFGKSYSNGTLTITGSGSNFQANEYTLVYTYNGSTSDIQTKTQTVGSGATSITFSGLSGTPKYFACIFEGTAGYYSTSNGYQRVIGVVYNGTRTYGVSMGSGAVASTTAWTYTYNNGSLTITSAGTNNGGYFHQATNVNYKLIYVV